MGWSSWVINLKIWFNLVPIINIKNRKAHIIMGKGVPNGPSTTGKPSGGGRGNNPPGGKGK